MGLATAKALSALGYDVSGWVRTPEGAGAAAAAANGLQCTAGRSALRNFVAGADVIVCLLPLTPETTGARCVCYNMCYNVFM
jgi:glyoxylate/hydroxypyruvate reductase